MSTIAWLAINGLTAVLAAVVLAGWAHARVPMRRPVILAVSSVAVAAGSLLVLFRPEQVPTGWITVLMEGPSSRNIQQLYGQGAHFGPEFGTLIELLSRHDPNTLPAVVHLNICLMAVNAILFFFLARGVLSAWCASLLFAVAYAGNLNTLHAAFSETPVALWTAIFFAGCVAAAVIQDTAHAPRWLRWTAIAWLGMLVLLACFLRAELVVLGAPAFAITVARELGWEPRVRRVVRAAVEVVRKLVAGRLWIFLAVAAACAALEFLRWTGDEVGWVAAGLRPLNLSFLTMPGTLGVFLPLGIVVLFVLGTVYALRHWFSFLLLPVTMLFLFKVYASAAHGVYFERFRYVSFLTPVAMFLALFGFRELSDWAHRWAWPPWWRRAALLLLVMTFPFWQAAGPKEIFRRRQQLPGLSQTGLLLAWNQQTEVRYLLDLLARYPDCVFLAKTTQTTWVADSKTGAQWELFGRPIPQYREIQVPGGTLEQIAAQAAPAASCVFYYRSLDCDLVGFEGCEIETAGRTPLEERVFEDLPYNDITEYGAHRAEVRLAIYPIVARGS